MEKNQYSLLTTIGMIVGIVIGSGIFFKSDNILIAANGSVLLGIILFCIAATGIIFGGLSIKELASRSDKAGGIIAYAEEYCSLSTACSIGWFLSFLYFPALIAVVSWVFAIYFCQLFNINISFEGQIVIGFLAMLLLYMINLLSKKLGGYFQNAATIIKLIPLFFIAISGLLFGDPSNISFNSNFHIGSSGLLAAIVPIAFSFDGWIVATSISHEIKNPKRNLPIALIVSPIFILLIYIAYFVGISIFVGPEKIMALGDSHVAYASNLLLGNLGSKLVLIFINISVLGTLNGLILGSIRMPYLLGIKGMIPKAKKFNTINPKYDLSLNSAICSFAITSLFLIIHYVTMKFDLTPNSDISEIAVIFSYICYIILYIQVIKLGIKGTIHGFLKGKFNPIMAILASITILIGSISNPMFFPYLLVFIIVWFSAKMFFRRKEISR
ncbi:MAG: amino acid permease [Clostridiales bacterium]|nr:amino acid permease [Clostridiales bacterium]